MSDADAGVVIHVGSPADDFPLDDIKHVNFHHFESLPAHRGDKIDSPEFICAGYRWKLNLFPGGLDSSRHGFCAISLSSMDLPNRNVSVDISTFCVLRPEIKGNIF